MPHRIPSAWEYVQFIFSTTAEKINALIAAGMISVPLWDDSLRAINYEASLLAAPLGCLWLVVQITSKIIDIIGGSIKKDPSDDSD